MAAKKEKRVFRLKDAVKNSEGKYVLFGLSSQVHDDTLGEKLKSGEWVEMTVEVAKARAKEAADAEARAKAEAEAAAKAAEANKG